MTATRPSVMAPSPAPAPPPRPPWPQVAAATVTSALALLALVAIGTAAHQTLLIPPMAASVALVAGAPALPLAQPRSVIVGQVLSALIGVLAGLVGHNAWVAAVAGGLALGAMLLARAAHSPAAATAVLGTFIHGWAPAVTFVICAGIAALVLVAFGRARAALGGPTYPAYWL